MENCILIPEHLRDIAINIKKAKRNTVYCQLRCSCGCQNFSVYKSQYDPSPLEVYEKSLKFPIFESVGKIDKQGRRYWVYKTIFGIPIGKRYHDELLLPNGSYCYSDIIKIKCVECGKEHIIFDGDKHGYDAITTVIENIVGTIHFQADYENQNYRTLRKCCGVEVAFQNDNSYEEIEQIFNSHKIPLTQEQYINAFSWFIVSAIVDGKTRVIFDMETS